MELCSCGFLCLDKYFLSTGGPVLMTDNIIWCCITGDDCTVVYSNKGMTEDRELWSYSISFTAHALAKGLLTRTYSQSLFPVFVVRAQRRWYYSSRLHRLQLSQICHWNQTRNRVIRVLIPIYILYYIYRALIYTAKSLRRVVQRKYYTRTASTEFAGFLQALDFTNFLLNPSFAVAAHL